jgi:hypothetical protein
MKVKRAPATRSVVASLKISAVLLEVIALAAGWRGLQK